MFALTTFLIVCISVVIAVCALLSAMGKVKSAPFKNMPKGRKPQGLGIKLGLTIKYGMPRALETASKYYRDEAVLTASGMRAPREGAKLRPKTA